MSLRETRPSLRPCASCGRHVREHEPRCPFCASEIATGVTSAARAVVPRLGRAALFAFGAAATTVAVASAEGCTNTTTPPDAAEVADTGGPAPLYGGPADAATDAPAPTDDTGNVGPAYGAPPDDAGTDAGLVAMYGGPPPDDAGVDAGGVAPLYGGSPGA